MCKKETKKIVPAILVDNYKDFEKRINLIENLTDLAQIDVMDGIFVDNKTFSEVKAIKEIKTKIKYEIHLMVKDIIKEINRWEVLKPIRISIPLESKKEDLECVIYNWQKKYSNIELGLSIEPDTSIDKILPYLDKIDYVLVMTVNSGYSGQKFHESALSKINIIKEHKPNIKIEIDGGVNKDTILIAKKYDIDYYAVNSVLFKSKDIKKEFEELNKML